MKKLPEHDKIQALNKTNKTPSTYNVATCKNPILNGISPVNWL